MAKNVNKAATTGRYVTTRSNQQAAAKVYIQASKKAGRAVPQRVRDLASGEHK